ncbi:MAG TPA: glycosyltransferase, partial [Terriglobia bacterium]
MVSVIIPALNEETSLEAALSSVQAAEGNAEVIVVDGESTDATPADAARYARVVSSPPGRALQMNRGAAAAHAN